MACPQKLALGHQLMMVTYPFIWKRPEPQSTASRLLPASSTFPWSDVLLREKKDDLSPRKITRTLPRHMEENKAIVLGSLDSRHARL